MKYSAVFALLLLSLSSHALIRKSATPQLHAPIAGNSAAAPNLSRGPGYADFATMPLPTPPPGFRKSPTSAETWRKRGIGFTIAGGVILAAGGVCWAASDAETQRQQANGGRSYTLIYYAGSALLIALGLVFLAIGLPIWLTHLK